MNLYKKVTPTIIEELKTIVGTQNIIYGDNQELEPYSHDEIPDIRLANMPEVVVRPGSAAEISKILVLANRELIPVTPRGAGSGESGGAIPIYGGIVLSVDRMDKILEVDRANMVVVVEPGVITSRINEALKSEGLFFAGYTADTSFIGGNIAENAGGAKAVKYGVTDRYVMGLEVVLPDGEIVQLGGKCVKDVAGYNLLHLMVGSEGTLGIFTKIILRLIPLNTEIVDIFALFKDVSSAIRMVPEIMTSSHIIPAAVEFIDHVSLEKTCDFIHDELPYQDAGAALLIEVDGNNAEQVEREAEEISELLMNGGAFEVFGGIDRSSKDRMWTIRHKIPDAFRAYSMVQCVEDIVVPISNIPLLMEEIEKLAPKYNILMPTYGHAGDGNMHVTLIKRPETPMEVWYVQEDKALQELYQIVKRLGGSISGEHGIGSKRRDYLAMVMDKKILSIQKQIKMVMDPKYILNPGKIFS